MVYKDNGKCSGRVTTFAGNYDLDISSWRQVFSACLGKMIAIQTACGEYVVKNQDWYVDFEKETIAFGGVEYPMAFIGSEAEESNTWLWGWENINQFSEKVVFFANYVKKLGEKWKLEPLTIAELELTDTFNGHTLSMVACGIFDNFCYYRCPHEGGAAFISFTNVPNEVFQPVDVKTFVDITLQCIQEYYIDHKIFAECFLLWNGTGFEWSGDTMTAHFDRELLVEFETVGNTTRIKNMRIG